jgi:acetyl esterase/lipase
MVWYLIPSFVGLALTLNAWRPCRWPSTLALVSFAFGWLTTELALHHLAWQVLLAAWAIHAGAFASALGLLGVLASVVSCTGLLLLHRRGEGARTSMDAALRAGIGPDFDARLSPHVLPWLGSAFSWPRILLPFAQGHRDVETLRGIPFGRVGGVDLKLDVHRPRDRAAGCPTLVYVHGGGWILGFRRFQGLPLMRHLAARGWVCFSIDYRLSPRATFPDHLVDVKRALAWVKEHAEEYGADPEFVVVCGNSAGAHLASLATLTANDTRYQPGFEDVSTSVSACIGLYGIYDFTDRHGHWPNGGLSLVLQHLVMKTSRARSPERYRDASPIAQVHSDAPPFLLVHGDSDTLAPPAESRRFAEALRGCGVPVVHAEVPDAQHAFEVFSSPRTAHFVTGATRFLSHLYGRYLEERSEAAAVLAARPRSGFVPRATETAEAAEAAIEVA